LHLARPEKTSPSPSFGVSPWFTRGSESNCSYSFVRKSVKPTSELFGLRSCFSSLYALIYFPFFGCRFQLTPSGESSRITPASSSSSVYDTLIFTLMICLLFNNTHFNQALIKLSDISIRGLLQGLRHYL